MTATVPLNPAALLQQLVQFDTTNPPGNESACVAYISRFEKRPGGSACFSPVGKSALRKDQWTGGNISAASQFVVKTFGMPSLKINNLAAANPSNSGSRAKMKE
jgi:hypothetical protein